MRKSWWMGLLAGVAGGLVLTTVTSLYAQNRGGARGAAVVCLDVVEVVSEYDRQKDLSAEANRIQGEMQNEAERRRTAIDSLQATLDVMNQSDPTYADRMREYYKLRVDFKNWGELMQADMTREVGLWTKTMYNEIMTVTAEIAQRDGYDMIFYKEAAELEGFDPEALQGQIRTRKLLWASPAVDITRQVLDALNANYRAQPKTQMIKISPSLTTP